MEGNIHTRDVLQRALNDLVDREAKVQALVDGAAKELAEVKRGVRTLRKALGEPDDRPGRRGGSGPRARFTDKVVNLLADLDTPPLRIAGIATRLDRPIDDYLKSILQHAVTAGRLKEKDGLYWVVAEKT